MLLNVFSLILVFLLHEQLCIDQGKSPIKSKVAKWEKPRESERIMFKQVINGYEGYKYLAKKKINRVAYDILDGATILVVKVKGEKRKWLFPRIRIIGFLEQVGKRPEAQLVDVLDKDPY
ncbi:hypothetical protein RF11_13896 [Thelohanellus kitauei]|uniref:Uncharacterized protein n=1 Tax=Thelohanellus kitauei TaxID=669202 RepID=A0A0C2I6V1_THEKT|nr:hypothetical protein RF11_13896 [Thelohanellus kitauei]